ncbi:uncharacterized protein LOC125227075 [Leguminivora glycinivorella]|uniref:uncharacterized protein LOC125227075 n=1 Tax=Leguminivora glycinivorella TaxID=1035111 RepID=UPI00200FD76C|nr:uncharacterized protein LOC125227075 [Leguminivora glycinivorella]
MEGLRCVQINLQHNKAATALLARQLKSDKFDIALIQEPYIYKGEIRGLNGTGGTILYICPETYLPYEAADPITTQLRDLADYGSRANTDLIIGCDANAHHVIWGSSDVNRRGEKVLEFLVSSSLQLLNKGNEPTFVNARRGEVIDITLASNNASNKVSSWHVSGEISLSDHRYICFRYTTKIKVEVILKRNPRNTNWLSFKDDLKADLGNPNGKLNSIIDIELEADKIGQAVHTAWTNNCPEKKILAKKVPWWNPEIAKLRKETRAVFNDAKRSNDFELYARKLTEYSKAVRKAKRKAWKNHCDQIGSIPEGMRLTKALATTKSVPLNSIRRSDGGMTETGLETLKGPLNRHVPFLALRETRKKKYETS